ncbi:MAG: hypothetical protein U1E05_00245 [Patescibacteria group bacterium]|nr:hypothetical protein [Patescibacteria group bacterium]
MYAAGTRTSRDSRRIGAAPRQYSKVAQELGVSLKTLYNKLNQDATLGKTA